MGSLRLLWKPCALYLEQAIKKKKKAGENKEKMRRATLRERARLFVAGLDKQVPDEVRAWMSGWFEDTERIPPSWRN